MARNSSTMTSCQTSRSHCLGGGSYHLRKTLRSQWHPKMGGRSKGGAGPSCSHPLNPYIPWRPLGGLSRTHLERNGSSRGHKVQVSNGIATFKLKHDSWVDRADFIDVKAQWSNVNPPAAHGEIRLLGRTRPSDPGNQSISLGGRERHGIREILSHSIELTPPASPGDGTSEKW